MPASKYTSEQHVEALELHRELGPGEAARRMGIPKPTIVSWARKEGVQTIVTSNTREAYQQRAEQGKLRRAELQVKMLEAAHDITNRLTTSYEDMMATMRGQAVTARTERPPGRETRALAQAVESLVKTIRLEQGDSTENVATWQSGIDLDAELKAFALGADAKSSQTVTESVRQEA